MGQQNKSAAERSTGVIDKLSNVSLAEGLIYVAALTIALLVLGFGVTEIMGI